MNAKDILTKFFVVTPLPTLNYTAKYLAPLQNNSWNLSAQLPIILSVYGDSFGTNGTTIVIGVLIFLALGVIWIRTENMQIPMMLAAILGTMVLFIPGLVPAEWYIYVVMMTVLTLAGVLYLFITGDR
jgi:hypothetical protein